MDHKFINLISLLPTVVLEPLLQAKQLTPHSKAHTKHNTNFRNFQLPLKSGENFHAGFVAYIAKTLLYLLLVRKHKGS